MDVDVVEVRDTQLTAGRYPIAVCASEALARQAAVRHCAQAGRTVESVWTRPRHRGAVIAVLRASYFREYEIWAMRFVDDDPGAAP